MGYFKRKRDRERIRALIRRSEREFAEDPSAAPTWQLVPRSPPRRRCYLRFAASDIEPFSGRRTGIFVAAGALLDSGEIDDISRDAVDRVLDWFNRHLPIPHAVHDERAVFLFKSSARTCTSYIWELVRLLGEHGVLCEMQVFRDPGLIVFEDAFQVAVIPSAGPSRL